MESEKVKEIKDLIDCDKKQNELGGIIVVNRQFLIEIIALINELESENEWLVGKVKEKVNEMATYTVNNQKLKGQIAELEKENKDYYDRLNNLQTYIDNHEQIWKGNTNNALKQFAERLKEKIVNTPHILGGERTIIDETLKEFIEK